MHFIPQNFSNYRLSILSEVPELLVSMMFDMLRFWSSFIPESNLTFSNYESFLPPSHSNRHSTFKEVCLLSCFLLLWYSLWMHAEYNKDAVQKATCVITGQLTPAPAIHGFNKLSKHLSPLQGTTYQNVAVTFLKTQTSTDIIILNALKTSFLELLICTHPHSHTHTDIQGKKVLL